MDFPWLYTVHFRFNGSCPTDYDYVSAYAIERIRLFYQNIHLINFSVFLSFFFQRF